MEASEVHEFTEQMKEAGESSLTHVALIISALAVLVALATVLGHREHTEAVLMQARASDQWNEYQSHRIRQEDVRATSELLSAMPGGDAPGVKSVEGGFKDRIDRWQKNIDEESEKARDLEHEVTVAERRAARFDVGEALLQIAVVLASVTLLTRRTLYVLFALTLGSVGLLAAASALFVR